MTDALPSFIRRLCTTRLRDVVRGRVDGRLDWRWAIAGSNLPAEAAALIVNVVRRTRLWRSEKADVAEELVAHFHDGLESGQDAQALTESFGDVRSAARLIRRAKKRGRPLVWHAWRWSLWSAVALLGVYLLLIGRVIVGDPNVATNYLHEVNRRAAAVDPDEAAWPEFRQALIELEFHNESMPSEIGKIVDATPGDEEWPDLQRYLVDHQSALAKLRLATTRNGLGYQVGYEWTPAGQSMFDMKLPEPGDQAGPAPELISVLLSHVVSLRSAALLLAADARRAAEAGDGDAVLEDLRAIFRLGRMAQETSFLVSGLVSISIDGTGYDIIEQQLTENPALWTDDQLSRLAHLLAGNRLDWQRMLRGERMLFYDMMQRLYTDDGHGDGRITNEGLVKLSQEYGGLFSWGNYRSGRAKEGDLAETIANEFGDLGGPALFLSAWMASRREVTDLYDRLMDRVEVRVRTPLWQGFTNDPLEEVKELASGSPPQKWVYAPVSLLFPAVPQVHRAFERSWGRREGVLVGLALELYHRRQGRWPETLAELMPKYLPELPVDRITGEPLKYRIEGDRPMVYSRGVDRDDDNGLLPVNEEGEPDAHYASPTFWQNAPRTESKHDGDWVIWTTVEPQTSSER